MNNQTRQKRITQTAIIGICANLAIAAVKIIIGLAAASLAIVSEGINNASDAASSFLTLVGTALSGKHPDEKHPFGYGRIEYLTGLVIGILILFTGVSMVRESISGIIHPGEMSVSVLSIVIVAFSAVAKFLLGTYTERMGKQTDSDSLIAVGKDSKNDSFISIVTIVSSVIFLVSGFSLDAYAGLLFSAIIIKAGIETLRNTVSDLIGGSGEEELARKLYSEIHKTPGIITAADMMLHNYGPGRYSGSVNVEIDHNRTVGSIYEVLHDLQLRIMHEYNVTMVFGIYAVDCDTSSSREMRRYIAEFIKSTEHIKSFHALYIRPDKHVIYCDLIADYELKDWDAARTAFLEHMKKKYPDDTIELTIETEYV